MIFSKIWFDLHHRFYLCALLTIFGTIFLIVIYPLMGLLLPFIEQDVSQQDMQTIRAVMTQYRLFMDEGWFRELQPVWLLSIILALGGVMTEKKTRSIYMTLSLPVARKKWVLYQWWITASAVLVLVGIAALLILAGGLFYGQGYPLLRAIVGSVILTLTALPWISITLAFTSRFEDRLRTLLAVLGCLFVIGILEDFQTTRSWTPVATLDALESGLIPWRSLAAILTVTAGALWTAITGFEKRDY